MVPRLTGAQQCDIYWMENYYSRAIDKSSYTLASSVPIYDSFWTFLMDMCEKQGLQDTLPYFSN